MLGSGAALKLWFKASTNKSVSVVLLQILKSLRPLSHLRREILVPLLVGVFEVLIDSLIATGEIFTEADCIKAAAAAGCSRSPLGERCRLFQTATESRVASSDALNYLWKSLALKYIRFWIIFWETVIAAHHL